MQTANHNEKLERIGLTKDQSAVYLYLIRNGNMPANLLARRLGISRTLMYKILEDLISRTLVFKDESFKVTRFSAAHPYSLRSIAEEGQKSADELARSIEQIIGPLAAEFNLQSQKPSVHFMEGLDGLTTVLEDTLTSSEPIYMYVDTDTLEQELLDIDSVYVKKRLKKGIPKKILMARTAASEAYSKENQSELTQTRLISSDSIPHFYSFMKIYDKKVCFISYKEGNITSTIIYDESIYTMQRFIFEALWGQASS